MKKTLVLGIALLAMFAIAGCCSDGHCTAKNHNTAQCGACSEEQDEKKQDNKTAMDDSQKNQQNKDDHAEGTKQISSR